MNGKYRTIVADPPWPGDWWAHGHRASGKTSGSTRIYGPSAPSYQLATLEEICALPIEALADDDAHLFLWVPDTHLVEGNGARVARAWGFEAGRLIIWAKRNIGLGRFPRPAHEALLVCKRGSLPFRLNNVPSVQHWKQPRIRGGKIHSAKPDGALDLIEQVSPGPYAELFARRARFGWDYPIGDQALGGVAA